MDHKQLIDDRIRTALKEGQASQEAARSVAAGKRQKPGLLRRMFTRLFSRLTHKSDRTAHHTQPTSLSRQP